MYVLSNMSVTSGIRKNESAWLCMLLHLYIVIIYHTRARLAILSSDGGSDAIFRFVTKVNPIYLYLFSMG